MKKIKSLLIMLLSVLLVFVLTSCTVPYTYVSIAGNYIKENRDAFADQIDSAHDQVNELIESSTGNPQAADYLRRLFGIETPAEQQTSSSEAEDQKPEEKPVQHPTASPEAPFDASKNDEEKSDETADTSDPGSISSNSSSAEAENEEKESEAQAKPSETQEKSAEEQGPSEPVPSLIKSEYIPEYVHYEKSEFEPLCEQFRQAGKEADETKLTELYDEIIVFLKNLYTMNTVAFLNYSVNVNEKYFDDEYNYTDKMITDCYDLFMTACKEVYESEGSEAFTKHADPLVVEEAKDYEPLTDTAKELMEQETKLETRYNTELDQINSVSYELKGRTYTFKELSDDSSSLSMLSFFNYNDFLKVYEGLLKKVNEKLGPIYVELLSIRAKLADEYGYDSYADYCYENVFGRDYTTKEAAEYCENIKKNVGCRFYEEAYYNIYNSSYFTTKYTTDEIFSILDKFTAGLDSFINDSLHELMNKKLYDIGEGDGRYAGSYTTSVFTEQVPFIFINSKNDLSCLSTLEHEFGHFTNDLYEEKDPDYFFVGGNYDVMEIHSNALQLLCSNHYGEIVDLEEAEAAKTYELAVQLSSVLDGCIYDEFQRKAYEKPDMTLPELNTLFGEISESYGEPMLPGTEYMWVLVNHSFENPMYYISYSISALSAMEIWTISRESEKKAVDVWMTVLKEADDEDYETVMKNAGLTPFTDSEGVLKICDTVLDNF